MAGDGFFEKFNRDMLVDLQSVATANGNIYLSLVTTLISLAITLYVVWVGYQTLAGKNQTPLPGLLWDLVKFGILLAFIHNTDGYMDAAIDALNDLKAGLAVQSVQSVWGDLDVLQVQSQALAEKLYGLDPEKTPLSGWTAKGLVWAGAMVLMLTVSLVMFIAEATLILLLVTAPIFLFCLMFGFLSSMFNNWLQLVFSSVLTLMFASMVSSVSIEFMNSIVTQINQQAELGNLTSMGATVLMAGVLTGGVVLLARFCATYVSSLGVTGAVQGFSRSSLIVFAGKSSPGNHQIQASHHQMHVLATEESSTRYISPASDYLDSVKLSQQAVMNMKARYL